MTDQRVSPQNSSVLAIIFLVLQAGGVVVCGFLAIMLVFVSDACDGTNCNTDLIVAGMAITALGPLALWVVSLVHTIVRARQDKANWWVPMLWSVVSGFVAVAGIVTAFQGGPNTFN